MARMKGIESFWAMLKRGFDTSYHHLSAWRLLRYLIKLSGMHNLCPKTTEDQMARIVKGTMGRRLSFS